MMEKDLELMREMDVREIDPDTLPDIADIRVDTSLPPEQRPPADERESLLFPQREPDRQDLFSRRGPAANSSGELPGDIVTKSAMDIAAPDLKNQAGQSAGILLY